MFQSRFLTPTVRMAGGIGGVALPARLWSRCETTQPRERVMVSDSVFHPPVMIASHPSGIRSVFTPNNADFIVGIYLRCNKDQYATVFSLNGDVMSQAEEVLERFGPNACIDSCEIRIVHRRSRFDDADNAKLKVLDSLTKLLESRFSNCTICETSYWELNNVARVNLDEIINLSPDNRYTRRIERYEDGTEYETISWERLLTTSCMFEIVLDPDPSKSYYNGMTTQYQPSYIHLKP